MSDPKLQNFKIEYPDLYAAIFKEGEKYGRGWQERMKAETNRLGAESGKETLTIEEKARAAFDSDPNLRAEFDNDFACWEAYYRADSQGRVRIAGRVVKSR